MNRTKVNPCTDMLTDLEYLEHMIPHHQVAVDMSEALIPHSTNPVILHLCRDIIRKQKYEIWEMQLMMKNISETLFAGKNGHIDDAVTKLEFYNPVLSRSKEGPCDPLFFKPDDHAKHMEHMKINDKSYLEHMIPHHQVAVDMSERLLLHTTHSYLLYFARKLIVDQQAEIFMMNNLLKQGNYNYKSPLFTIPE